MKGPARKSDYFERLRRTLRRLIRNLGEAGIERRYLVFGGEGEVPTRKPTVPTDARSEFLANRAMGDWAERSLNHAIREACPEWKVVQYGSTERIAAGHPDFRNAIWPGWKKPDSTASAPIYCSCHLVMAALMIFRTGNLRAPTRSPSGPKELSRCVPANSKR